MRMIILSVIFLVLSCSAPNTPTASYSGKWDDSYTDYIHIHLEKYKYLVEFNPSKDYWVKVLKAMAKAESGLVLNSRYEEALGLDAVTKLPIVSEGLFQMSYQDSLIHGCNFNWKEDSTKNEKSLNKTIFLPENQFQCALIVLNKQLGKRGVLITQDNPYYWAVLDTSRPGHKNYLKYFEQE